MKNGLTFGEAFGVPPGAAPDLDEVWVDALSITFGELDGHTWDWGAMQWEKPR